MSYVYHALYSYFSRDNVALPGFAAFFKAASAEEREHAEILMDYQNVRGGRVKLASISESRTANFWTAIFLDCLFSRPWSCALYVLLAVGRAARSSDGRGKRGRSSPLTTITHHSRHNTAPPPSQPRPNAPNPLQ